MSRSPRLAHPHHRVTAVVVTHDGGRWLVDVLAALGRQTRPPQLVVAADTGSRDGCADHLVAHLGDDHVVTLGRATGFGAAVAAALARADDLVASAPPAPPPRRRAADANAPARPVDWIWLLHDDCAPDPAALERLLDAAADAPSVAVLGPKANDWDDERLLVEVGLTADHAGRRETWLERREFDQGQHDTQRDVLAVGSAGCLIRRDVWDALGGYDPRLPLLRDDIDFGWRANLAGHRVVVVPQARIRHVRAGWTGKRPLDAAGGGRPAGVDRRHSLATLLANLTPLAVALAVPRLLAGALFRTLAFLLTRQLAAARDEVAAVWWNARHVPQLMAARRARRGLAVVPRRAVDRLFVGRSARLRGYLEAAGSWLTGGGVADELPSAGLGEDVPDDALEPATWRGVRLIRARPGVGLVLGLLAITVVAARSLLGGGSLVGGALLPSPDAASDYWREFAGSWHRAGLGTDAPASPAVALLAALSTVLLGKAWLALDVLLIGSVPLAGWAAWSASRLLVTSVWSRLWAAATYALLPVATGAIASGRLDVAIVAAAAPVIGARLYRLLATDPRHAGWRTAFAGGLVFAGVAAFAPQVVLLIGATTVLGGLVVLLTATPASRAGAVRRIAATATAVLTMLVVLLPWGRQLVDQPRWLVAGYDGFARLTPSGVDGWDVLLLRPGGPGTPVRWLVAGVVLAGFAGLVRRRRLRVAVGGCALAVGMWLAALAAVRGVGPLPQGHPGPALAFAACGLLVSALIAADGARTRLAATSFGWRQLTASVVALVAAATPVAAAAVWLVRGADGPLERRQTDALPAVARSQLHLHAGSRALWLEMDPQQRSVRYALTDADGPELPDGLLDRDDVAVRLLDSTVADLASPRGSGAAEALATFAVRYVAVTKPVDAELAAALDAQPGLSRVAFVGDVQLWRTLTPSSRVFLLPPALAAQARAGRFHSRDTLRAARPVELPGGLEAATARLTAARGERLIVLSERRDDDWVATLDGRRLRPVMAYGWAQAWVLPERAGTLAVRRDAAPRRVGVAVHALLLVIAVVLAAPSVRRGDDLPADDDEEAAGPLAGAEPVLVDADPALATGNVRRLP